MEDAAAVVQRWKAAQEARDLDAVMACWHPDVEVVHMIRPDRSWRGADVYRRVMERIWAKSAEGREDHVAHAALGNTVFLETLTYHADGSVIPCVTVFEVEDGRFRRARVYTDVPSSDGRSMDDWVEEMNE